MTLEELQAKVTELTESMTALTDTNNGLKADLTKAKAELRKGQTIDPNDYSALQAENEAFKTKLADADKQTKKLAEERDKAVKTLETESQVTVNMQRERDLTEGLASINVTNAINLKAAKAMLAAQVQVVTKDGVRISMVGDKPISEHLKEWATTDEGKHFVAAPNNNGGGAQGGNQNATNKAFKDMGSDERTALFRSDPTKYEALKAAST
jgi:predicted RNase H-like nuclease (RuvC/YqgF family)